uniref:Ig-like domain-containing protein n=1 Tax=Electrophorus electricus TaxID=8005 RepID=A0A4W4H9M8_ELEEL
MKAFALLSFYTLTHINTCSLYFSLFFCKYTDFNSSEWSICQHLKYKQHKKYWCCERVTAFNYCTIMAYANNTNKKVTVTDNPAQTLFTVTVRDLQERNTGAYWCAVEISGIFQPDVKTQLYITVKSAPAVSVTKSRVSGEEGSSVSVQCLYSAAYKKEAKKWCRSIDWTCYTVGRTNTSQNSAVQISDDGKGTFTVLMTGLKKTDAGWYWCSTGGLEVPVHFDVTDALAGILFCI